VIVVDTNVVARLVLPGQETALAEAVHRRDPDWVAPPLLYSEIRNVLVMMIRRREFHEEQAIRAAERAVQILKGDQVPVATHDVLNLAVRSGCTAYDCEFVVVARMLEAPLVTSDRQVLASFPRIAVSPEVFVAR
jgi:predicted nucleic acid-binding protein